MEDSAEDYDGERVLWAITVLLLLTFVYWLDMRIII